MWHIPDFSLSILTILLGFTMAKRLRNGKVRQISPLIPRRIVCFAKWVKGAKCVSSDFLNEKVLMILNCIILKIKAQSNQLVNWKLWVALFYPEQSVEF